MPDPITTPAVTPAATVASEPAAVVAEPTTEPAVVAAADPAKPAATTLTEEPAAADPAAAVEYTDFTTPEGVTLDAELLSQATPLFKELGLSQEQAQKLVDFQAANMQKMQQAQQESFTKLIGDWQAQAKADKEFGGDKFEENVGIARKAIQTFGNPAFKQLMEDHGVGNHPEMIRFMLNIGRTLKEDVPGATGGAVAGKSDRVSILYPQP